MLALWGGVQLVAITAAEAVERAVFPWLVRPVRRARAGPPDGAATVGNRDQRRT